nr:MAG TPA: hypothetical protein [Caudoviricetes sp.]
MIQAIEIKLNEEGYEAERQEAEMRRKSKY